MIPPAAAADYCNAADKIASVILQLDPILLDTILAAVAAAVVMAEAMMMVEEDVEMLQKFAVVAEKGATIQYEVATVPNYLE